MKIKLFACLLCIFIVIMAICILSACGETKVSDTTISKVDTVETQPENNKSIPYQETAVLEGYESLPFYELLTKYAKEQIAEEFDEDAQNEFKVSYEDDSDGVESEGTMPTSNGEKKIIYTVHIESKDSDYTYEIHVRFFMTLTENNILRVNSLFVQDDNDMEIITDKDDIDNILSRIFDELLVGEPVTNNTVANAEQTNDNLAQNLLNQMTGYWWGITNDSYSAVEYISLNSDSFYTGVYPGGSSSGGEIEKVSLTESGVLELQIHSPEQPELGGGTIPEKWFTVYIASNDNFSSEITVLSEGYSNEFLYVSKSWEGMTAAADLYYTMLELG